VSGGGGTALCMSENKGGTVAEFGGFGKSCACGAHEFVEATEGGYADKRLGCPYGSPLRNIGTVPREPEEETLCWSSGSKGRRGGIGLKGGKV